jgi:hypothetical protein
MNDVSWSTVMNGAANSEQQTPSQIASHRDHAAVHSEHSHLTPSQIARDIQLGSHGHGPEHAHEMTEAQLKPPDMTWAEWVMKSRQTQGGNGGNDQNPLERGRVLPDEELDHNKGRSR